MRRLTSSIRDAMLPLAGRTRRKDWSSPDDTVLILQPDHLGDIVLSQPAVGLIRSQHPTSRLIAIVGPWSHEVASLSWPVDEIITLPFPGFSRSERGSPIDPYIQLRIHAARLIELRARLAYVLRPDAWWAAWLASLIAPEVVTANDSRASRFSTLTADDHDSDHATVRAFRIAATGVPGSPPTWSTFPLTLELSAEAADTASRLLMTRRITEPYVVVHPGSGAAVKEWPAHRWVKVVDELGRDGLHTIVTGSGAEADLCAGIAALCPTCTSLAGQTSVSVLAEVMRNAAVVMGPDCGPLHLAVAAGTPSIHLFGPSDPRRYGPWGDPTLHRVVRAGWTCPRCGDLSPDRPAGCGCMLAIFPESVIDAARSVLRQHAN